MKMVGVPLISRRSPSRRVAWMAASTSGEALSVLAIGIFSAFILYDLKRVQDGEETNYISATLGVYLSLYNVFQSLLSLLGIFGGNDD